MYLNRGLLVDVFNKYCFWLLFPCFFMGFFFCVFFLPYSEMTNSFASQTSVPFMMKMTHPACIVVMTTVPFPVDPLVMACIPFVCLCVSLHLSVCQPAFVCVSVCMCVSLCVLSVCASVCTIVSYWSWPITMYVCVYPCVYPCFNTNIHSIKW